MRLDLKLQGSRPHKVVRKIKCGPEAQLDCHMQEGTGVLLVTMRESWSLMEAQKQRA